MTPLETIKEILDDNKIQVPEESLEVLRDLIDMQTDLILDKWLEHKELTCEGVK